MEFPSFGGSDIHVCSPFEWEVTWPRISKIQTWGDVDGVLLKVTKYHQCGILLWDKSQQNNVGWEARSASTVEITPLSVHGSEFPVNQKGIRPLHPPIVVRSPSVQGWASGGGTKLGDLANDLRVWRQYKKLFRAVPRKWPDPAFTWVQLGEAPELSPTPRKQHNRKIRKEFKKLLPKWNDLWCVRHKKAVFIWHQNHVSHMMQHHIGKLEFTGVYMCFFWWCGIIKRPRKYHGSHKACWRARWLFPAPGRSSHPEPGGTFPCPEVEQRFSGMLLEMQDQKAFLLFLTLRSKNRLLKSSLIKYHFQNPI